MKNHGDAQSKRCQENRRWFRNGDFAANCETAAQWSISLLRELMTGGLQAGGEDRVGERAVGSSCDLAGDGFGRLDDDDVRLDADVNERQMIRRIELRGRQPNPHTRDVKREDALHRAFAIAANADDHSTMRGILRDWGLSRD